MRLNFTVQRYNPELDITPHPEDYRVEVSRGMTVLEALIRIKNEQERRSSRAAPQFDKNYSGMTRS